MAKKPQIEPSDSIEVRVFDIDGEFIEVDMVTKENGILYVWCDIPISPDQCLKMAVELAHEGVLPNVYINPKDLS